MTDLVQSSESSVVDGARWVTGAFVLVGGLNYGYSLLLTRLLDVRSYSSFAAGQGLILWASTIATVAVPWVLAQALARARSDEERFAAIRFAVTMSIVSGAISAVAVGAVSLGFAGTGVAVVIAASTFIIFLGTATTGYLQGREQMRALSVLYVAENLIKNFTGLLLVVVAGLQETGALAAFGIGGAVMLLRWPRAPRPPGQIRPTVSPGLWRQTLCIASAQGVVSLLTATDVVLVALLPGNQAMAASYQASAALARIPLFVAGSVAMAFFPALSRGGASGSARNALAARAMRMYAAVVLPLVAVLATAPAPVLSLVFPAQYGAIATLLKFTAVAGAAAGGISLVTAFFQAASDYGCLRWLAPGIAGYVAALLLGWQSGGITGMAVGAAAGATTLLGLLLARLVRQQGLDSLARIGVIEPALAAAVLFVLRPHPALWLAAAVIVGLRACHRFLRTGASPKRVPHWGARRP